MTQSVSHDSVDDIYRAEKSLSDAKEFITIVNKPSKNVRLTIYVFIFFQRLMGMREGEPNYNWD